MLHEELLEIQLDEFPEKTYSWSGTSMQITEVAIALANSNHLIIDSTRTKDDFIRNFLAWFHVPGSNIGKDTDNIKKRTKKKNYLEELNNILEEIQKDA
jgi:hypothetical protein